MRVRRARPEDQEALARLIAQFRVTLAQFRGRIARVDLEAARAELAEYVTGGYPIFVAQIDGAKVVGYLVCRVDGDVLWAESLFVSPEHRRQAIGSALYSEAERLARELGGDAPYNWVHPNNGQIVSFLQKRGYSVLNLVELRRPRPGEETTGKIRVGEQEFDY